MEGVRFASVVSQKAHVAAAVTGYAMASCFCSARLHAAVSSEFKKKLRQAETKEYRNTALLSSASTNTALLSPPKVE